MQLKKTLDFPLCMGNRMNPMLKLGLASPHSWGHILAILILFCGLIKALEISVSIPQVCFCSCGLGSHICPPNTTEGSHQYLQQQG